LGGFNVAPITDTKKRREVVTWSKSHPRGRVPHPGKKETSGPDLQTKRTQIPCEKGTSLFLRDYGRERQREGKNAIHREKNIIVRGIKECEKRKKLRGGVTEKKTLESYSRKKKKLSKAKHLKEANLN